MVRVFAKSVAAAFAGLFPQREVIVRSGVRIRHYSLSPRRQHLIASLFVLLLLWALVATATAVITHRRIAADDRALAETRAVYKARLGESESRAEKIAQELASYDERFDMIAQELAERQGRLLEAVSRKSTLDAQLATARVRLRDLTERHERARKEFGEASEQVSALKRRLENEQTRAALLRTNLALLTDALARAAEARDLSIAEIRALKVEMRDRERAYLEAESKKDRALRQVEAATRSSLDGLGKVLDNTGVNVERLLEDIQKSYGGSGGHYIPADLEALPGDRLLSTGRVVRLIEDLERAGQMRLAIENLPLALPLRDRFRFTSHFGPRRDPINKRPAFHEGLDFAAPRGTIVYATAPGRVIRAGRLRGYGLVLRIRHAFGFETVFAHNSRLLVGVGQNVARGDPIAEVGNTGRSTGTHLHYEVRYRRKALNPMNFIKAGKDVF